MQTSEAMPAEATTIGANDPCTIRITSATKRLLRLIECKNLAHASEKWLEFREKKHLNASDMGRVNPWLCNADGRAIGHISYNGNVWLGLEPMASDQTLLYERPSNAVDAELEIEQPTTTTTNEEPTMATTTKSKPKRKTATKSKAKTATKPRAAAPPSMPPKAKPAKAAKPAATKKQKGATKETGAAIVRRLFEANPTLGFAEIVRMAEAEGVKRNTATGALVRIKQSA